MFQNLDEFVSSKILKKKYLCKYLRFFIKARGLGILSPQKEGF